MRDNIYLLIVLVMLGIFLLVFLMILLHVRNQNKLLFQKKKMAETEIEHRKALTNTLIISQEEERKRIGMDLHDEVGTALSALRMYIEQTLPDEHVQINKSKQESKNKIDSIIQQVRKISHNLSPFFKGAYELKDALEDIAGSISITARIKASIDFGGIDNFNCLNEEAQLALYRVICELINNTVKHAGATELKINFRKELSNLKVLYTDNGVGILLTDINRKGIGLMNIESRLDMMNAIYEIDSQPDSGFRFSIKIPV